MKWEKVNIEEIGFITSGGTPSTGNPAFWNGEIGWITPKDLSNYKFRYISNGERNISEEGLKNSSAKLVKANSVLLSSRAPIGYLAIAEVDLTTNQGFKNITSNEKCDSVFLFYCLKNNIEYLKSLGVGATYPELSATRLKEVKLAIPPLPIQRKIASILSAYDDLIENNLKRIKLLEEKAFLRYKQIVREEKLERKKLRDVIELKYGKALKADSRKNGKYPVYGSSGKVGTHIDFFVTGPGIIVGRKGNIGTVFWSHENFWPIDTVYYVVSELSYYFLYFNLKEQHFVNTDAAVPGLNRNFALDNWIEIPNDIVIKSFDNEIIPVFQLMYILQNQNTKLREARDILLPRLMNGEIEV